MIDRITADRILDTAQIYDVVSDFITLKKRGVNYVGLCPFHADKTPSFYVSQSKNICKCFACGEGGTPAQFIMKHEQISYYEALRWLAKKYGIEIKERELSDEEKRLSSDRESMMIVNSWAQKFFTSRLFEHEEGKTVGLTYFNDRRKFRNDIIQKFQLGYSLEKRNDLYNSAVTQGYKEEFLLKTGLIYKRDDGMVSDRFHGRVIFPIHSVSGKIVAFGGRIMKDNDKVAKYVNSPESELYHKSNELYGIFFARKAIIKADKCYLVEGYTDVISMHQTGVENVVAPCGTALTKEQIRLIHRFTTNVTLLYDGDGAGQKAALRGIDLFLEEGMNVKIVVLPANEDPDSFARSRSSFDFTVYMTEHEKDCIRFKAEMMLKDAGNDPIKKADLIKNIMESVAVIQDNIVRSVYIKDCCHLLDVDEQTLINEVTKIRNRRNNSASVTQYREQKAVTNTASASGEPVSDKPVDSEPDNSANNIEHRPKPRQSPFKKLETSLLRYIVRFGERVLFYTDGEEYGYNKQFVKVAEYIQTELQKDNIEFQTPLYKDIMEEAVTLCENDDFESQKYFLNHNNLEISELAANMVSSRYVLSKIYKEDDDELSQLENWIVDDIIALKIAYIKHKINEVNKQISLCQGDEEKMNELLGVIMKLNSDKLKYNDKFARRIIM